MVKRRNAFTMIELVFTIVILGILSAVALPKLAATRSDAEVSQIAQNVGTSVMDIASYAVSKGGTDSDFSMMSNSIKDMVDAGDATLDDNEATILISGEDCIKIRVEENATNNDVNVSYIDSSNQKCLSLQSTVRQANYSIKLGGLSVVY